MGSLTPTEKGCLSAEELSRGIRLSCQATGDSGYAGRDYLQTALFSTGGGRASCNSRLIAAARVKKIFISSAEDQRLQRVRNQQTADCCIFRKILLRGGTAVLIDEELTALRKGIRPQRCLQRS